LTAAANLNVLIRPEPLKPRFKAQFTVAQFSVSTGHKPHTKELYTMERWICTICQYVYDPAVGDPDRGIAPGTSFEALPDDWSCPLCGAGKDVFEKE
jgi:rubredoxin